MNERSCVTWTVTIGGYSEKSDLDEALSVFHAMDEELDLVIVIHLILACGKFGALEVGKLIYNYTISNGLKSNVTVCNALLDMYAKCGSIGEAQKLFSTMNVKNVVSWTTMISGFTLNGKFQASLDHFNRMLKMGFQPNHVTFIAILQACSHAGLLEMGLKFFNMMIKTSKINPGLDNYSCMIDLLGCRGKLKEALKFIQEMPLQPDAELKAAAPYVEMANIYASARDWNGVADMHVEMKSKGVVKWPGQSVTVVDGKCCMFTVEDRCRWEGFRVFETLDGLVLQLKDEMDSFDLEEVMLLFSHGA
ncbi:hypothetical protein BUALT_Bualt11G0005800 [Buddleja alternifolia]|uniref:Pentatricopeptide repeat-containing protein n=1 Tax=Buddleja alternifolia TaxID=168488 RepID=A0AAV6WZK4_9LAMI|nr:hypothetical protein BUALT_Bualt11G0005800 [Buddleja alternifolia]